MSGRGHRRLRPCSKKNYERKKYQARSHDAPNDARRDAPQSSVALSGDLLVDPIWESISRLERQGIKVLALTCDGASTNRRLWNLHCKGRDITEKGVLYKVPNIYAADSSHFLYFVSDPPHLMKTTRNCWANKSRNLQVRCNWKA